MEKTGCKKCRRWVDGIQTNTVWNFNESKDKKIYTKIDISMGGRRNAQLNFESCGRDQKVNKAILENIKFCPYCGMDLTKDLEVKKDVR